MDITVCVEDNYHRSIMNVYYFVFLACVFTESNNEPILVSIDESVPIGYRLIESIVEPYNAQLQIASIRSSNTLLHDAYRDRFRLDIDNNSTIPGSFRITTTQPLSLQPYPSTVDETYLYIVLACNGQHYPLLTIKISNVNDYRPIFYGQLPYRLHISEVTFLCINLSNATIYFVGNTS